LWSISSLSLEADLEWLRVVLICADIQNRKGWVILWTNSYLKTIFYADLLWYFFIICQSIIKRSFKPSDLCRIYEHVTRVQINILCAREQRSQKKESLWDIHRCKNFFCLLISFARNLLSLRLWVIDAKQIIIILLKVRLKFITFVEVEANWNYIDSLQDHAWEILLENKICVTHISFLEWSSKIHKRNI